jgi:hypothetical protein
MNSTNISFAQIGLHDARISQVVLGPDSVHIYLREAFISPEHPSNNIGGWACVEPAELCFVSVSRQAARIWNDATSAWGPWAVPATSPIESEIMEALETSDESQRVFTLAGFGESGWTEWKISADRFTLKWSSMRTATELLGSNTWLRGIHIPWGP